jgi:glycerophosphoryl diester phosphodiesterase
VTLVLGHRGAPRQAPENTIAGFARALALGADGVELDVHRTRDRALVVRHDAAGPPGVWADLTLAEIRHAVPEVPVLEEALDTCAGKLVNIEIKNSLADPDWDPQHHVAEMVVATLAARGHRDDVLVSSFDLASVDRVHVLAPSVATALLTFAGDPLAALMTADEHGHTALHPKIDQLAGPAADDVVREAHARGIRVNVWTVNEPDEIRRLASAGVDAICTDVPDVALSALGRAA